MRFGIVGAGVIAEYHREAILRTQGAELVGVYDKFPEAARRFADKHGLVVFPSIAELVGKGGAEVATIGTPSGWHLEPATEAMEAGAHVLCEKPLEVTVERIDRMIDAAERTNRKLGGILQMRTFSGSRKAKELLDSGALGKILIADAYIKYYRTQEYYDSDAWRGTYALDGGGATMNQGIHWVDLIQWLMGDAQAVYASCATLGHNIEVEDINHAVVKWPGGGQGVLEATTCAKPGFPTRIEIHGENGSLILEDARITKLVMGEKEIPQEESTAAGGHADPKVFSVEGHILHVQDMIEAVRENRDPLVPGAEARKSVKLITSMYESSRGGKWISL